MNILIKNRLIAVCALAALSCASFAINGSAQSAITLFDIGGGVRALAMGEAFVGLADDEQAVFYNPAGLAFLSGISGSANYERHFGASNYLSALGGTRNIGAGLYLFSFGDVEQRDDSDDVVGTFTFSNLAITAAGGAPLSFIPLGFTRGIDQLAMGTRLKFLAVSSLDGGNGSAFALDLGWLFKDDNLINRLIPGSGVSLFQAGLNIENLISLGVGYGGRGERLPFKVKTGLALRPTPELLIALDIAVPFEFHLGGEYSLSLPSPLSRVDIRAGSYIRGGTFGFTAGFGLAKEPFRLDYAFNSHPTLPASHRLAFAMQF